MIINLVLNTQPKEGRIFLILKLTFSILCDKSVYNIRILNYEIIFMILSRVDILKLHKISFNKRISNSLLIYYSSQLERKKGFLGFKLGLDLRLCSSTFINFQKLYKEYIIALIYRILELISLN